VAGEDERGMQLGSEVRGGINPHFAFAIFGITRADEYAVGAVGDEFGGCVREVACE
jgi:hypothetical protein